MGGACQGRSCAFPLGLPDPDEIRQIKGKILFMHVFDPRYLTEPTPVVPGFGFAPGQSNHSQLKGFKPAAIQRLYRQYYTETNNIFFLTK